MISDDFRKITLLDWLANDLLLTVNSCEPASSDASFRRYFRVKLPDKQLIAMDAPPDKENIEPFIKVAELFSRYDIQVPEIYYQNRQDGFLLLEDFGSQSFLDVVTQKNSTLLYSSALDDLFRLQLRVPDDSDLPCYDVALLQRELDIFAEWFLNKAWNIEIPAPLWDTVRHVLVTTALEQPVTCVHRDFHSRNLMAISNYSLGIIDFQDAVIGPITYDLVSLLRDCYIAWPQHQVEKWVSQYYKKLKNAELIDCDLTLFTRWFDLMGVQRHLKAIGIFSRLYLRDNKSGYLKDIPRTLNYVLTQVRKYPELSEFNDYLEQHILPKYPELK